jgi:hypothetical protein
MATFNDPSNDAKIIIADLLFESVFGLNIIINFFTEYNEEEATVPIRNFEFIAKNYLKKDFIVHLFPMIPF